MPALDAGGADPAQRGLPRPVRARRWCSRSGVRGLDLNRRQGSGRGSTDAGDLTGLVVLYRGIPAGAKSRIEYGGDGTGLEGRLVVLHTLLLSVGVRRHHPLRRGRRHWPPRWKRRRQGREV